MVDLKQFIEQAITEANSATKEKAVDAEQKEEQYVNREYSREMEKLGLEMRVAEIDRYKDEHSVRLNLIKDIFTFTCIWLILVFILVFGCAMGNLDLSDSVLITILTTSTAQVLGFFVIVLNYLFNKNKST